MRPTTWWSALWADITHWAFDLFAGHSCDMAREFRRPRCTWRDLRPAPHEREDA